jgi:hypothetical protein|tara:strand:- start:386 stop:586 length:201 start_codon:yes stop_codon:yes gene_type:complete
MTVHDGYALEERLLLYEAGDLDEEETNILFQELVDAGLIDNLQGHYGRMAKALMEANLISMKGGTE